MHNISPDIVYHGQVLHVQTYQHPQWFQAKIWRHLYDSSYSSRALTLRSLRENRGRLFWRAEFWSRTLFSISGSFGFKVNEDIWWENESFDWPNVKESFDWLVFRQPELPTLSAPASLTCLTRTHQGAIVILGQHQPYHNHHYQNQHHEFTSGRE